MDLRHVSALATAALLGCAPTIAASEEAIIDGTVDEGDPQVAAVMTWSSSCGEAPRIVCSGVLVAPRVVLTAAHCVEDVLRAGQGGVFFRDSLGDDEHIVVIRGRTHPGWDGESASLDLGVLVLARAPAVAPLAISAHRVDELEAGATLRVVGFGVSSVDATESDGIKREGTMTLGPIGETVFAAIPAPASSCRIDSGGPVLAMFADGEALVGITAAGDAACAERADNGRVELAWAELIETEVARLASEPEPLPLDPAVLAGLCSAVCDGDSDCPPPMRCERLIDGPRCVLAANGPGAFGEECANDIECRAQPCVRLASSGADACRCFDACGGLLPPPPADAGGPSDAGHVDPPESGCSASTSAPGLGLLPMILLTATALGRLRPARRRRALSERTTSPRRAAPRGGRGSRARGRSGA